MSLLIHNAAIVDDNRHFHGYVATKGRFITHVGAGNPPVSLFETCESVIDAGGKLLIPGVIDTHVHFRDPGLTHKGDMLSESLAALEGGVTSVIDMPNTKPATVTTAAVDDKIADASQKMKCNYGFFIGTTNNNIEELRRADYTKIAGVKLFLGSSTGNMLVDDDSTLNQLFASVEAPIAVHAESEAIVSANKRDALAKFPQGEVPIAEHSRIRSREACVEASRLAIDLAVKHRHKLHLLHVSTADELSLLTPTARRFVTAETAPHYLWFTSSDYDRLGSRIKCNPAIKEESDRKALTEAVADGFIATVATDHAPHLLSEKEGDGVTATSGMPGIKYSLPLMLELSRQGKVSHARIVDAMCNNPARIFSIDRRGFLRPGYYADLTLVDTDAEPYIVADADAGGKCGWTPYAGTTLHSRVALVAVNGEVVLDAEKRPDSTTPCGLPLRFDRAAE